MSFVIQVVAGKAEEVAGSGVTTGADDNAASGRLGAKIATQDPQDMT